jgi:hypothetical protein
MNKPKKQTILEWDHFCSPPPTMAGFSTIESTAESAIVKGINVDLQFPIK